MPRASAAESSLVCQDIHRARGFLVFIPRPHFFKRLTPAAAVPCLSQGSFVIPVIPLPVSLSGQEQL